MILLFYCIPLVYENKTYIYIYIMPICEISIIVLSMLFKFHPHKIADRVIVREEF